MPQTNGDLPADLLSTMETLPVLRIITAAHDADEMYTGEKSNHWVLNLVISLKESVRLEISPLPSPRGYGCLIIDKVRYIVSKDAVKSNDLAVREGLTVKDVIDLLLANGFHRYRFAVGEQGCRFWVDSILVLLRQHQLTTVEFETQVARAALLRIWDSEGELMPGSSQTPIVPGTFY